MSMILSSILFGLLCIFREINIILKNRTINVINIFGIMYGVTYGLLTSYYLYYTQYQGNSIHRISQLDSLDVWHVYAIISYIVIQLIYNSFPNNVKKNTTEQPTKKELKILQWTTIILIVIGSVSFYLWGQVYGSVMGMIIEGTAVRSGISDIYNPYSFMIRWVNLLFIATLLVIKLIKLGFNKTFNIVILVPLIYINVLYLLVCDGRLMMAMYMLLVMLVSFDLLKINGVNRKSLVKLGCASLLAFLLITQLNEITFYIRNGEALDSVYTESENNFIIDEFSYIFIGAQQAASQSVTEGSPLLFLDDFIMGIFAWIPTRFKPNIELTNIWDYNTNLYCNGTFGGQLPCDFITHSIYTCGIIGFIFMVIIWAFTIVFFDKIIRNSQNPFMEALGYYIVYRIIYLVNYCSIFYFILGLFPIFISFLIWRFVRILFTIKDRT